MEALSIGGTRPGGARGAGGAGWALAKGRELGGYRVVKPLGRGGMGEVYLVENVEMGMPYALKLLPADLSADPEFRERFRREARLMAELDHPGIVRALHMAQEAGRYFLVMDFVAGPDGESCPLDRVLSRRGRLPEDEVLRTTLALADALAYAHSRGVVHRDIKPGNVLLDCEGRARLSDFGLARVVGDDYFRTVALATGALSLGRTRGGPDLTDADRAIIGTYEYMSPEQQAGRPADPRSDIYSLGLMVYRMLTGEHARGRFPDPSRLGCSARWDGMIDRALATSPDDRYADVAELMGDLRVPERAKPRVREEPLPPAPSEGDLRTPERARARVREKRPRPAVPGIPRLRGLGGGEPPPSIEVDLGRGAKMALVLVRPGEFTMGSPADERGRNPDEGPEHLVRITTAFYMGRHEVTQEQYERVTGQDPAFFKGADRPVEMVAWQDAVGFCRALSEGTGWPFRLPAEAEWEYACRAGTRGARFFDGTGSRLEDYAWSFESSKQRTFPVSGKLPNPWGLHDVYGNVWEWCADWYDAGYYSTSPRDDPQGPAEGELRVLRGGSWFDSGRTCRSAERLALEPALRYADVGFRVVASPPGL